MHNKLQKLIPMYHHSYVGPNAELYVAADSHVNSPRFINTVWTPT